MQSAPHNSRKKEIRTLTLTSRQTLTPHMLRLTLSGDFPSDQIGAYIKLIFPDAQNERGILRTYTIAAQRKNEIDLDFVIHGTSGIACNWAQTAPIGAQIKIGGPGARKLVDFAADYFIFAADMTALPALSANLALLSANAKGYAVIEVLSAADQQNLIHPKGVTINWLINPNAGANSNLLSDNLRHLTPPVNTYVWGACEFNSMRSLRTLWRDEWQIASTNYYLSSYWKLGASEDAHRQIKAQDASLQE